MCRDQGLGHKKKGRFMSNMTDNKKRMAVIVLSIMGFINMGNEGCEKEQAARSLKMDVNIGKIQARTVTLPTGEVVDFPYVVNSLFYREVMNHNSFVILNSIPNASFSSISGVATKGEFGVTEIQDPDLRVLSKYNFISSGSSSNLSGVSQKVVEDSSEELTCLYDSAQTLLGGEVISYQSSAGVGLRVGYDNNGPVNIGNTSGQIDFSNTKLELGLRADDALTEQIQVLGDGKAYQNNTAFSINIGVLPIGLDFFYKTALSDVIRDAMNDALDGIVDGFKKRNASNKWEDSWESRVLYDKDIANNDTHIAFRGGYRYNMQVKDRFTVRNMHYAWEGTPCASKLKYKIPLGTGPIALVEVIEVGDNVAVGQVIQYYVEERIRPGAQIKIQSLFSPESPKKAAK